MDIENNELAILPELYQKHLNIEQMLNEIKSGDIFQGKLFIDRNNNEDGIYYIKILISFLHIGKIIISKFNFEIKIKGFNNLNRSLCGDIVAVQILPETGLKFFKLLLVIV